jgi:hypothetical protein
MTHYRTAIEDDGDAGFYGYLGGDRWQTPADHVRAERRAGTGAARAMLQFMVADEDCPPYCYKCHPPRRGKLAFDA